MEYNGTQRIIYAEEDVERVHKAIRDEEREIASINVEIENLMLEIRRLRFKQTKHEEKIRIFRSGLTLARRLPHEILASVFEFCVEDGWTRFPLTASHVCTQWRAAARIPSVWSHVYVRSGNQDLYGRTSFWIRRSEAVPLTITLDLEHDATSPETIPAVVQLLLESSRRWRRLKIVSGLLSKANFVLDLCRPASFPQLRELDITILEDFDTTPNGTQIDPSGELSDLSACFQGATSLQQLVISRNILSFPPSTLPSSITHLSLHLPSHATSAILSLSALLDGLQQVPLVRTLTVAVPKGLSRRFVSEVDEQRAISLHTLNTLTVIGNLEIFGFLPYIQTPCLRELRLRSSLDPLGVPIESFGTDVLKYIRSSFPPLEVLELRDLDLSEDHFTSCLSLLPTLKALRLHESDMTDTILDMLHGPDSLCPRLQVVDLRWCGHITGSALVRLVRGRLVNHESSNEPGDAIASITMINCAFIGEKDIIELSHFVVCRIVMDGVDDYCRTAGCCNNERYRRRFYLRNIESLENHGTRVVF